MKRLLITGAAGGMGRVMRGKLAGLAEIVRLNHRAPIKDLGANEEFALADLADRDAVDRAVAGVDGIVHLGGVSTEAAFDPILKGNILGLYNLYEAARAHGKPRILFASSNHTIGYYRQDERINADAPVRPDTLYGVSKCFGEALARMYFDKFGQETAIVRIGSCFAKPINHRMLASWLSYDDFARLAARVFHVPRLGCPIIYGASANRQSWWDNTQTDWLGWKPQDTADAWRAEIEATVPRPAADDPSAVYQGGHFVSQPIIGQN